MKRIYFLFFALLMPLFMSAQTYPTGITPYTLIQIDSYFARSQWNSAESVLKKLGYKKALERNGTYVYSRGCSVRMSNGSVSATATSSNGYASYIQLDVSSGQNTFLSVKFLNSKGSSYFANLLKQTKYRLSGKVWQQPSTGNCIVQEGRKFFVPGVEGVDAYM